MIAGLKTRVARLAARQARQDLRLWLVPCTPTLSATAVLAQCGIVVQSSDLVVGLTGTAPQVQTFCALLEVVMKATQFRRLTRLEAAVDVHKTAPLVIRYTEHIPADIGRDAWDICRDQGLLPPAVLRGERLCVLLPEKLEPEEHDAYLEAYRAWEAALPRCVVHPLVRLYQDTCPECRAVAPAPTPTPPGPERPGDGEPEPHGPEPRPTRKHCPRCAGEPVVPVGREWRCEHCDYPAYRRG
jgi:hypothetical protein